MMGSVRLVLICVAIATFSASFQGYDQTGDSSDPSEQPVFLSGGPASGAGKMMCGIDVEIDDVERQIRKAEEKLKLTWNEIQRAAEKAENASTEEDRDYWWSEEKDLRGTVEYLEMKKGYLTREKESLQQEKELILRGYQMEMEKRQQEIELLKKKEILRQREKELAQKKEILRKMLEKEAKAKASLEEAKRKSQGP